LRTTLPKHFAICIFDMRSRHICTMHVGDKNFAKLTTKFDIPRQRRVLSPATLNFNFDFFQRSDLLECIKHFIRCKCRGALSTVKIMTAIVRWRCLIYSTIQITVHVLNSV